MPIRINLLAEAQAQEEMRRKDPVKRATWVAGFLVAIVVLWATSLQVKIVAARVTLNGIQREWRKLDKNYSQAVEQRRRSLDAEEKLSALQNYTTNRVLWGTCLNAVQQTLNGVDDIKVMRVRGEQGYNYTEETKPRTNGTATIPGRPATSAEKIVLSLEAIDHSPQPGSQVSRFKQTISATPYFQERLQKTNGVLLTSLSAPMAGALAPTPYVTFTLQCYFPEKVR
jgi:hypothetical protein